MSPFRYLCHVPSDGDRWDERATGDMIGSLVRVVAGADWSRPVTRHPLRVEYACVAPDHGLYLILDVRHADDKPRMAAVWGEPSPPTLIRIGVGFTVDESYPIPGGHHVFESVNLMEAFLAPEPARSAK